jgi:hypothetical protein
MVVSIRFLVCLLNFPAVFFCRNKGVRKYALSPGSHRSATPIVQGFAEIVLQWRNMQKFWGTMAWSVRNGVVARLVRLYYTIVKLFSKTFKKTLDIS